ncbi:3369_t:CDS:1, partial [Cetraspora pellucida]
FNLNEQNYIKSDQITKDIKNTDKTAYNYFIYHLNANVKTGHTIILIGDENGEFYEKLKYFKEQNKKTAEFPIFGEIYEYTNFMITLDGKRVSGFSLILKHAIE